MNRTFAQLVAGLATLLVALALTSAPASASDFCGGQTINDHQTCFGAARNFMIVQGFADVTGVCVGYNAVERAACSAGGWQQAIYLTGSYAVRTPRIIGISPNNARVVGAQAY